MIESAFPILEVSDLPRALEFYCDAFGAELVYRFPDAGEPVYVSLKAGSSSLGIGLAEDAAPGVPSNLLLWFYVDDVDRVARELTAAGATMLEEPVDQPWGERVAFVADPFGTRVRLATMPQAVASQPAAEE
ncbi:VOC family protein [Agromyces silvae]|uniref:VOC family protein n=1 Tax=Agromyces silvae TaxID=3388266 RepID=UPI00280B1EB1|nr:glyoxalase superfamily protein [Agromyces protaetiae]